MTPSLWLGGALVVTIGLFIGGVTIKHKAELKGARNEGIAIGTGAAATATLEAAKQTAEAERVAEAETPLVTVPAELAAICRRSASCIERYTLK
jgi:hypothetical protein